MRAISLSTSYPIICLNSLKRRAIISSHMKKILKIAAALSMAVICMPVMKIKAAPDYSDSNYWDSTCTSDNIKDVNTFNACKSYTEYIASKTPDLQAKLDEINSEKAQVQGNIEKYGQQIADLQKDADSASAKVKEIASQVSAKEDAIAQTQYGIDETSQEIADGKITVNHADFLLAGYSDGG